MLLSKLIENLGSLHFIVCEFCLNKKRGENTTTHQLEWLKKKKAKETNTKY